MRPFLLTSLLTYAAVLTGATAFDPAHWCSTMLVGCCLFVFTPVVMAVSMLSVCLPLCGVVGAIGALFAWGRPSGAPELIRDILA